MKNVMNLVPDAIAATNAKALKWSRDTMPDNDFSTKVGKYVLNVWQWINDDDGTEHYSISIRHNDDTIDVQKFDEKQANLNGVKELFECAKYSFLNIDDVIDEMTEILKRRNSRSEW